MVPATVETWAVMTTPPPNEGLPATVTQPAWNWDASVRLPQQVYAPPPEFLERIRNTVAVREQAVRFCAGTDVTPEVKQEIAKFLTCVQSPTPISDCAGEKLPALRNFIFVVLKSSIERRAEDWNPQVILDDLNQWSAFSLKFEHATSGNSISLV